MDNYNLYDYLFKIVIVGDSGSGKSSILSRYVDEKFTHDHISTIGVDFVIHNVEYNGKLIKLQIWDTAGQCRFRTISSMYYKGAHAAIIVFSIDNRKSFENLLSWIEELDKYDNYPKIIVGNKSDKIEQREVYYTEAKEFCDRYNILYIETSAKNNININKLFEEIINDVYTKQLECNKVLVSEYKSIDLTKDKDKSFYNCCY